MVPGESAIWARSSLTVQMATYYWSGDAQGHAASPLGGNGF